MACGAPTVCLAGNAAINEVAGSAAAFVPAMTAATTADAMADVIDSLVGDTRLRVDLRSRGLRRASVFTWARAAAETVACYVKALDGLRRRSPATSGSGRTALA
jgi:glycosyltransferase involved in cell wall biosynthesis